MIIRMVKSVEGKGNAIVGIGVGDTGVLEANIEGEEFDGRKNTPE